MFFSKRRRKRVFVLSLDGVPHSFLENSFKSGLMPRFKKIVKENGTLHRMNSVIPTISSVAWASFMTGTNPAKHGIFGFIDRNLNPFEAFIPTAKNLNFPPLWNILRDAGKKSIVVNVPVTTPVTRRDGIVMISGFLSTKLEKATNPEELSEKLQKMGYIIDVDPWKAKENKDEFVSDLFKALEKRKEVFYFLDKKFGDWDFFMLHIMETDRINHFLWADWEDDEKPYSDNFNKFYSLIDEFVDEICNFLGDNVSLIILSDHGFTRIKREVFLNKWLEDEGYLRFENSKPEGLKDISGDSLAYSLIPGRVYINLQGREAIGSVPYGRYEELRGELLNRLDGIRDPDTGDSMVEKVYRREEIYKGPLLERAADLIIKPVDGYDFKGNFKPQSLTGKSHIQGMHTFDDAFLFIRGVELKRKPESIIDVTPTIFKLLDIDVPSHLDGEALI
jgi:predicted AlkP superfamily phosphohydrolase/phosphomutase